MILELLNNWERGSLKGFNPRKQRNGPTGDIKLTWLHEFTRFENWQQPEYDDFAKFAPAEEF